MKRWLAVSTLVTILAPPAALLDAETQDAGAPPSAETLAEAPFYRRYLVSGNELDDAILEMEKRIEASPNDANLHNDFGNLLALRQFPEQAADQYELAASLDPANFISLYNLGLLRETEGKAGSAITAYKKSIARKPGFPPSRYRLGRLYEKSGKPEEAVTQYAKAFWIDPSMRDPKRNPLVIDSELTYRASIANYERDLARATLDREAAFHEEPAFRRIPVDRSVDASELESEPAPAPREVGTGTPGAPASQGPAPVRRPRATGPSDAPMNPRPRPTSSRPARGARPAPQPVVTPEPPAVAPEETGEPVPFEGMTPQPEMEPTPAVPDEEVEPS